jgi:hypothetical protein
MGRRYKKTRKVRGGSKYPLMPANFSLSSGLPMAKQTGGDGSAASYGVAVAGDLKTQFNNALSQGGVSGNLPGNTLIGTSGQGIPPMSQYPTAQQLAMAQSGGARRRRGGFIEPMLSQAAAPLALLALQQTYGRRPKRSFKRNRKSRR